MSKTLEQRLKAAFDESRLLILGGQVLFGFQFQGCFQDAFASLPRHARVLQCFGLALILVAVASLIAPSMYHQIADRGRASPRALRMVTRLTYVALAPLTLGLATSVFIVFEHVINTSAGMLAGSSFFLVGLSMFYSLGYWLRRPGDGMVKSEGETPIGKKIEQLLTEARVIIPGGQALLGFQFVATLTHSFADLPTAWMYLHLFGLCSVSAAVVLLMTPAALHRLAYRGEDVQDFFRIASALVIAAAYPLALGISSELAIVFFIVSGNVAAVIAGALSFTILTSLWYLFPIMQRRPTKTSPSLAVRSGVVDL